MGGWKGKRMRRKYNIAQSQADSNFQYHACKREKGGVTIKMTRQDNKVEKRAKKLKKIEY